MKSGMMPRRYPCLAAILMLGPWASPALAAGCKLHILADLPVTMEGMRVSVPVKVNGKDTRLWLDSGAFFSILPKAKTLELELKLEPLPGNFYLAGVGGNVSVELTTVKSFGIVGQELKNMQFIVGGSDAGNGLIGRNILAMADTEFDLAHGSVKIIRPEGCEHAGFAYWAAGKPFFTVPLAANNSNSRDHIFGLSVSINGARINAEFDTGAPASLISRRAAERAGIDLSGPSVIPFSGIGGFGRRSKKGWSVPVENISIGDEQILRTRLNVIDGPIADVVGAPDMLLGADFILAHHIYVARAQRRIYFTYSGGKPFSSFASASTEAPAPELPPGTYRVEAMEDPAAHPRTAGEFARRGNVRLAQRLFAGAIADLSEAIRLDPDTADYYRDRAKAYRESDALVLARTDLDKALALSPDDGGLLRARAFMRLSQHDRTGALVDAEAAARVTPPSSLDAADIAFLFERLRQPARAIAMFDAVIAAHRRDSALGGLLNGRCWVRALANVELDKALADCNDAIKRDGPKAAYLDSRGLIYFRRREFAAAIAGYDAALALIPTIPWTLYLRGLAKIALGQTDAGKADQTAGEAIQPDIAEEVRSYGIGA